MPDNAQTFKTVVDGGHAASLDVELYKTKNVYLSHAVSLVMLLFKWMEVINFSKYSIQKKEGV